MDLANAGILAATSLPHPMLTDADRNLLQAMQLERLRGFFADALSTADLSLSLDAVLTIVLASPQEVDELLAEVEILLDFAWLITGADAVEVYFAGEKVWSAATRDRLELEAILQYEDDATMTAVTIEKLLETPQPTATTADDRLLPMRTIATQIADLTEQSVDAVINWILGTGRVRSDRGLLVAPAAIADDAIDQYTLQLAADLKAKIRGGVADLPAAVEAATNGNGAAIVEAATPAEIASSAAEQVEPAKATRKPAATKKPAAKKTTAKKTTRTAAKTAPVVEPEASTPTA